MRLIECLNKAKDLGYTTFGEAVRYFSTQLPEEEKNELMWETDFVKSGCRHSDGTRLTDDAPADSIIKIITDEFYAAHYDITKNANKNANFARRLGEE